MLTREESKNLYKLLVGLDLSPEEIKYKISIFTENPKREIQIGDIYLDGYDNIIRIVNVTTPDEDGYALKDSGENSYLLNGRMYPHVTCRGDLDLSKVYKLMEIDNAD